MTIWTPERQEAARAECRRWAGTPHMNRISVPGQGIDCIRFVFEVVIAAGILERFDLPCYRESLGILRASNVMEALMREYGNSEPVDLSGRDAVHEFGDVAIFQCGAQSNHAGIVVDGAVWHVPGKGRVGPEAWVNVAPKLQRLMRFTAPGFRQDIRTLTWDKIKASI